MAKLATVNQLISAGPSEAKDQLDRCICHLAAVAAIKREWSNGKTERQTLNSFVSIKLKRSGKLTKDIKLLKTTRFELQFLFFCMRASQYCHKSHTQLKQSYVVGGWLGVVGWWFVVGAEIIET